VKVLEPYWLWLSGMVTLVAETAKLGAAANARGLLTWEQKARIAPMKMGPNNLRMTKLLFQIGSRYADELDEFDCT
jgi:hypothetical protein